jgi:hypothetical protein
MPHLGFDQSNAAELPAEGVLQAEMPRSHAWLLRQRPGDMPLHRLKACTNELAVA